MRRVTVLAMVGLLSSCVVMSTDEWEQVDAHRRQLADDVEAAKRAEAAAVTRATASEAEAESLGDDLTSAREEIRQLRRHTGQLEATLGAMSAELDLAVSNYQQALLTFEEQIREAQASLQVTVSGRLCQMQVENPQRRLDVTVAVEEIVESGADIQATLVQLPLIIFVDMEALAEVRDACFLEANLRSPKGDGFYLVGTDIGPGIWRSSGRGGACYWARRDDRQNIIASYFGRAGGTVTIEPSDFEVQFERCGTFTQLGS